MRLADFRYAATGQQPRNRMNQMLSPSRAGSQMSQGSYEHMLNEFMGFYEGKLQELTAKEGGVSHIPITGNLYMYKTLSNFADAAGLFRKKQSAFVTVGLYLIIFLQLFAPLCLLISAVRTIEFGHNGSYFGAHEASSIQSSGTELPPIFMRVLGSTFLVLFMMNGIYVLNNDEEETRKVTELAFMFKTVGRINPMMGTLAVGGLRQRALMGGGDNDMLLNAGGEAMASTGPVPLPQVRWLYIGAFVNSLCLVLCSLAMVFMFILEDGPKDLVLDGLGLAFLYNLDDIGGDLAFLDEKWDEDFMGSIYGELADAEAGLLDDAARRRQETFTADTIYSMSRVLLRVLLGVLPLIFLFLEMKKVEDGPPQAPGMPKAHFV